MIAQVTALQCLPAEQPVTRDEAGPPYSPPTTRAVTCCPNAQGWSRDFKWLWTILNTIKNSKDKR